MIAIVDYGMGNIHSVQKALEAVAGRCLVTNQPAEIKKADKIVLPGVGAFADAMHELEKQGLIPALVEGIKKNKPFLGICLGMQLLFSASEESKGIKGLGVLRGIVKRLQDRPHLKVPHMGWNDLIIKGPNCPLLKGIPDKSYVYFCHSYYADPQDKNIIGAITNYSNGFASLVWQDNVFGAQFHPEKSQKVGLKIVENFVGLC